MDKIELIEIINDFVNHHGLWYEFKIYIESKGYTIEEFGFTDDEL